MMPSFHSGRTGWGWIAMAGGMVVFWGLVLALAVALVVTLVRALDRPTATAPGPSPSAQQILAERFARGEIDEPEYLRSIATLTDARHGTPAP